MFQTFHLFHVDVATVDRDVAYIAIVVHVCCKFLSLIFYLFFVMYLLQVFQTSRIGLAVVQGKIIHRFLRGRIGQITAYIECHTSIHIPRN